MINLDLFINIFPIKRIINKLNIKKSILLNSKTLYIVFKELKINSYISTIKLFEKEILPDMFCDENHRISSLYL